MSHVEYEDVIAVPVEEVFAALLRVEDAPRWMVGLREVRNVSGRNQGDTFDWTFQMAGKLTFHGQTVFAALEPDRYLREEGSGDLTNAWDWRLFPEAAGTLVKVRVEYVVPGGSLIGGMLDKLFVERQNQKDLEQSLANLKQLLEG
ncbi:MAG: SRPBCC family protein [Oscillochloris sp.]|nr:SRPBCC family protein [Oscillochloris sp.]